jgi:hypothetical protein
MKEHKEQMEKKPWHRPEIKELKIQEDTKGAGGPGGDPLPPSS